AQSGQPALYNGRIYSLVEQTPKRLTAYALEYRLLVAQRRAPDLASALAVRPIGVTGLLTGPDGLVLGRRAKHVAADAGLWEPAAAGSLARPEPAEQILEELMEELGLDRGKVQSPLPLGLVEDATSRVIDIVFRIETDLSAAALHAAWRNRGSDEYAEIRIVPPAELPRFLAEHHGQLLRVLEPMLRLGGFLPD
ncbi:MAG: hypothetical protein ACREFC_00975, partial [Stellaceae bacterium]